MSRFNSSFSVAASITTSHWPTNLKSPPIRMRFSAATCPMPVPICPAPMMPMLLMSSMPSVMALSSALQLGERGVQFRHDLEQIPDQAVIGDLKNRRFFVLVDGDDDLGILHAGEMLDRAGNADRDVEVGRDDL